MIIKIIQLLHFILVAIISFSIFLPFTEIKYNSLVLLIYILFQYLTNYGKCGLTQLEYYIMGEKYQEGFLYRLIKPVITVSESYFDNYLFILHIIYIIILAYQLEYFII
jgi:hypothetical protein